MTKRLLFEMTIAALLIGFICGGCRVLEIHIHAESGSTVIIDAQQQADKPMDFTGGGLKVPLLP